MGDGHDPFLTWLGGWLCGSGLTASVIALILSYTEGPC